MNAVLIPPALEYACQRAIDLILELAGGTVSSQVKADYRADQSSGSIQIAFATFTANTGSSYPR
jgi:phenylalanyl-tRNA synthetase beta subunit